jgi:ATP-dependent Clp protease, protease subunit
MSVPRADSYPGGLPPRPGVPGVPGSPGEPGQPRRPGWPGRPGELPEPGWPAPHRPPAAPPAYLPPTPSRGWTDQGDWPGRIYQRLLEQRIVLASGHLDGEAATVLCAQLLTLDAEGDGPVRLELQGLDAELPAALTVMGVLDVLRVPVTGYVAGQLGGAAIGVLAACTHRLAYPSAVLSLAEPRLNLDGTATEVSAQQEQVAAMLDTLYIRLAEVTGREVDEIRGDARRGRFFTVDEAVSYGLIEAQATAEPRRPAGPRR